MRSKGESSMIHSASAAVSDRVEIMFFILLDFHVRTCLKIMITPDSNCGSDKWIKKNPNL